MHVEVAVKIANNASHRQINKESNLKRAAGQRTSPSPHPLSLCLSQYPLLSSLFSVQSMCMSRPKGNLSNGNIVWAIKQYWLKARHGMARSEETWQGVEEGRGGRGRVLTVQLFLGEAKADSLEFELTIM